MKKLFLLLVLVLFSTISFAQGSWIYPEISANMQIIDNNTVAPAGIFVYVEVLTSDGNYSTWYNTTYPIPITVAPSSFYSTFQSSSTGIAVWKPSPMPMNYYVLNFRCEKRNGSLLSRTNVYKVAQLDANNNLVVSSTVVLTLP
ncbi:MAG: hypothetical protein EOM90_04840 [Alphaproteobacteria bacterium]|nr:hypothetical protein [Alphaproteobacteria bacterium]